MSFETKPPGEKTTPICRKAIINKKIMNLGVTFRRSNRHS
jgi:hypothetical protein